MIHNYRVASIIIAVIGVLFLFLSRHVEQFGMFTAGVILIVGAIIVFVVKKRYGDRVFSAFVSSFSFRKKHLLILVYDFLFWAVVTVAVVIFGRILEGKAAALNINLGAPGALSEQLLPTNLVLIQEFFATAVLGAVIVLLLTLVAYAVFSPLSWAVVLKMKCSKQLCKRYLVFSLIWVGATAILLLIVLAALRQSALLPAMAILFFLIVHFSFIANIFVMKESLGKALRRTFSRGALLHQFVVPYVFAFAVYLVLSHLHVVVRDSVGLATVISALAFLLFFAWFKRYMNKVVDMVS